MTTSNLLVTVIPFAVVLILLLVIVSLVVRLGEARKRYEVSSQQALLLHTLMRMWQDYINSNGLHKGKPPA